MSFQVNHGATNITSYVISYTRTKRICTGVGELVLDISKEYTTTINPYEEIIIYEDSVKKGTYFVAEIRKSLPTATIQIEAQDITKQLNDYFIDDLYEITYPTTSRYWMEKFMDEAGISYNFLSASNGHNMSVNTWVGRVTLLEFIQQMCRENGWYFLADENNVLDIGKLDVDYSSYSASFVDTVITALDYSKDDKMLRNRVLVRGNADFITGIWINGEVSTIPPWNYDNNDYRTTLITSPDVPDIATATQLANQLLTETKKITEVKTVQVAGFQDIAPGSIVYIQSNYFSGLGMVTSIQSRVDNRGEITTLLVDERCPRIFGYYASLGNVYIGTDGQGIWKKPIKYDDTWVQDSTGMGNRSVSALAMYRGIASSVADDLLFVRTPTSTWTQILPTFYDENGDLVSNIICTDTAVNKSNAQIESIFTTEDADIDGWDFSPIIWGRARSWLTITNPNAVTVTYPIVTEGNYNHYGYSLDNDGNNTFITSVSFITGSGTSEYRVKNMFQMINYDMWEATPDIYDYYSASHITSGTVQKKVLDYNKIDRYTFGDYIFGLHNIGLDFPRDFIASGITDTVSVEYPPYIDDENVYSEDIAYRIVFNSSFTENWEQYLIQKLDFSTGTYSYPVTNLLYVAGDVDWCYINGTYIVSHYLLFVYEYYNENDDYGLFFKTYDINTGSLSTPHTVWVKDSAESCYGSWGDYKPASCILNGELYLQIFYSCSGQTQVDIVRINPNGNSTHWNTGLGSPYWDENDFILPYLMPSTSDDSVYFVYRRPSDSYRWYAKVDTNLNLTDIANVSTGLPDYGYIPRMTFSNTERYFLITNYTSGHTEVYDESFSYIGEVDDAYGGGFFYSIDPRLDDVNHSFIYKATGGNKGTVRRFNVYTTEDTLIYTTVTGDMTSNYLKPRIIGQFIHSGSNLILYADNAPTPSGIPGGSSTGTRVLQFDGVEFHDLGNTSTILNVETSKNYPTVLFGGYKTLNSPLLYANLSDEVEFDHMFLPSGHYISDLRNATILREDTIDDMLFYVSESGIKVTDLHDLSGAYISIISGYGNFSEYVTHIETSNYWDDPFVFASTYSGVTSSFYQKDGREITEPETDFTERNTNIPTSKITVIRLDDMI